MKVGWAVMGKEPGSYQDYSVLRADETRFTKADYSTIFHRFTPGTPPARTSSHDPYAALPWATISYAPLGRGSTLGIAVRQWSDHVDGTGRLIATTEYVWVRFADLERTPVSYAGLYSTLVDGDSPLRSRLDGEDDGEDEDKRDAGPVDVGIPRLDPAAIAEYIEDESYFHIAAGTAALLLTGPVAVVEGRLVGRRRPATRRVAHPPHPLDQVAERLAFLDAVAALLPYGLRARLVASTWADGGTLHRIRLAFTDSPRPGDAVVHWRDPDGLPDTMTRPAVEYFRLLVRAREENHSTEGIVAHLAAARYTAGCRMADDFHALLCLADLVDGPSFARHVVTPMADAAAKLTVGRQAHPDPDPTAGLADRLPAIRVADMVRAQQARGVLACGRATRAMDDAVRGALGAGAAGSELVAFELVCHPLLGDVDGRDTEPDSAWMWLEWLECSPALRELVAPFRHAVDGPPGETGDTAGDDTILGRVGEREPYVLALVRLARRSGAAQARALQPLVRQWLWPRVTGLSPEQRGRWAPEVAQFSAATPDHMAVDDMFLLLLGAGHLVWLPNRLRTADATTYTARMLEVFQAVLDEHEAGNVTDHVQDELARALETGGWPPECQAADRMLWLLEHMARRAAPVRPRTVAVVSRYLRATPHGRRLQYAKAWRERIKSRQADAPPR